MFRRIATAAVITTALATVLPQTAEAGFGIGGSIGTGFLRKDGDTSRVLTNLEILPHYKIAMLYADLGMKFNLETKGDFVFRPGVRLDLKLLYVRAAIPLRATDGGDYGFLFGLGTMFGVGPVSIFGEIDMNLSKELGFSNVPIEFRAGVQFSF
jgi:hypothetical protein